MTEYLSTEKAMKVAGMLNKIRTRDERAEVCSVGTLTILAAEEHLEWFARMVSDLEYERTVLLAAIDRVPDGDKLRDEVEAEMNQ